ncbi:MAG: hypothetical protein H7Z13_16970 [Ferruginibacter sp.]|nr:hypothetical protein [Ferruginibacter sp.]
MRCLLLIVIFYSITSPLQSQTAEKIIAELKSINKKIINKPCSTGSTALISNRAMNVFLADKTGYLSESGDLSFYTNYVTLNTTEGKLMINHNFQKTTGIDEPVNKLLSIGIYANVANSLAAKFLDKKFENELGVTVNYKWLSKVKTRFTGCTPIQNNKNQQQAMDALRAAIIHSLEIEINKKETEFKTSIHTIDTADVPGQNIQAATAVMSKHFYENLKKEFAEKFATLQAATLTATSNFSVITTGWTSLTANLPLVFPNYFIAPSLTGTFREKHPYPLEVMLSHTRLWESSQLGRLFLTLGGKVFFNNSKLGYSLNKTSFTEYKSRGGTDTLRLAGLKNDQAYIGQYETFVTPSLRGRLVYFPASSHVGISFLLEQNFGSYNLLNGRLGIPVVLINSKKTPAVNFEFHILFYDMTDKTAPDKRTGNKTSIGLGVGIPFSRLMY